jgi:oxygen-independent coproporphyrinogen-3 oxidase
LEYKEEILSLDDIKMEKVLLGFRCITGVHQELLTSKELQKVQELVKEKKLVIDNNRIINPNYLLADELALYILD